MTTNRVISRQKETWISLAGIAVGFAMVLFIALVSVASERFGLGAKDFREFVVLLIFFGALCGFATYSLCKARQQ